MSWAEDQWWFGLEDFIIERALVDIDDSIPYLDVCPDPFKECELGNWVTKDGTIIPFKYMTDEHLYNCIKMIETGRLNRTWALPYLKSELNSR